MPQIALSLQLKAFEERQLTQITACDLSKAFDCVDYNILVKKLEFYSLVQFYSLTPIFIFGVQLQFFKSYLSLRGRTQFVDTEMASGLLKQRQGFITGPILFVLMINDLPCNILGSATITYADDTDFLSVQPSFDDFS